MNILQAFGRMEGYGADSANRPTRDNNPGDIEWGQFARAHGATRPETMKDGSVGRFAYFPTPAIGWAALGALLSIGRYSTATVEQAVNIYAPPIENPTSLYVANVCKWVGCKPTDTIASLLPKSATA